MPHFHDLPNCIYPGKLRVKSDGTFAGSRLDVFGEDGEWHELKAMSIRIQIGPGELPLAIVEIMSPEIEIEGAPPEIANDPRSCDTTQNAED